MITFLFLFSLLTVQGQKARIDATKVGTFEYSADVFSGRDVFGFFYFIKDNAFFKTQGKQTFEYKNVSLGNLTDAAIENPLKIVLFYENFNRIILLDNQLNEVQKINLSENNNPVTAAAVGLSLNNQLWIYNSLDQKIGLYDYLKNTYKSISNPLRETIKETQSSFNYFFWIDNNNNYYSCDIFGKIKSLGKLPEYDLVKIINQDEIIYTKNGNLYLLDRKKNEKYQIEILEKSFENFYYKDQILAIFTSEGIINYKITIP
jgi:hypothetical protein